MLLETVLFACLLCYRGCYVEAHGRLIQPPGRSTAWRFGFDTPNNYNDHELYCGGYSTQWGKNGGKCGICGDPYQMPRPRANENTGTYGRGVIVKKYKRGQKIEIGIELTANHNGFFEFSICAHNAPNLPEKEDCFKHLLNQADGNGHRFFPGLESRKYFPTYVLPKDLTCTQCVLQWRYVAGNNWGTCPNGTGMVGCGPQEEFRSCADIKITEDDGSADDTPALTPEDVPEDDEEFNTIDFGRQAGEVNERRTTSGQVVAISLAILFVLFLFLGLLTYYLVKKGKLQKFYKKGITPTTPKWASKILPTLTLPSLKKEPTALSPSIKIYGAQPVSNPQGPPVAPPRRHRKSSSSSNDFSVGSDAPMNPIRRPILSISSPTKVSINGIEITPNSTPTPGEPMDKMSN